MSYHPDILYEPLAVMGMLGAWGRTNLTSSSFCRRRQFSTALAQPLPVSPRPWTKMTVAVWPAVAGKTRGALRAREAIVGLLFAGKGMWWRCKGSVEDVDGSCCQDG